MHMIYAIWLLLGLVLGSILLIYARSYSQRGEIQVLTIALVIAAIIYVGFAIIWGNLIWVAIELAGLPIYGLFAWLAIRYAYYYLLGIGWMLHPIWDVVLHLFGPGRWLAPEWYAMGCITFDLLIAVYIFYRMSYWQQQNAQYTSAVVSEA